MYLNKSKVYLGSFGNENPQGVLDFVFSVTVVAAWSCRFLPTPGNTCNGSIPCRLSSSISPMPDNIRILGDKIAPADRTISLVAVKTFPPGSSTLVAQSFSMITLLTGELVIMDF